MESCTHAYDKQATPGDMVGSSDCSKAWHDMLRQHMKSAYLLQADSPVCSLGEVHKPTETIHMQR